jgi:hypothetical protein
VGSTGLGTALVVVLVVVVVRVQVLALLTPTEFRARDTSLKALTVLFLAVRLAALASAEVALLLRKRCHAVAHHLFRGEGS